MSRSCLDCIDHQDYLTIFDMVNYMRSALLNLIDDRHIKSLTSQETRCPAGRLDLKPELP